mgnify:CR=1 FL=1
MTTFALELLRENRINSPKCFDVRHANIMQKITYGSAIIPSGQFFEEQGSFFEISLLSS